MKVSEKSNGRSLFSLQQVAYVRLLEEMKLISHAYFSELYSKTF